MFRAASAAIHSDQAITDTRTVRITHDDGDLISRSQILALLRRDRDAYFREHFAQDPATGTFEAGNVYEEALSEMDEHLEFIKNFPGVKPIAKLVNNNQVGCLNIIETAPNVTIDIGTPLYRVPA